MDSEQESPQAEPEQFSALVERIIDKATKNRFDTRVLSDMRRFLHSRIHHYADVLNYSPAEILEKLEARRDVTAPNYYNNQNFPRLDAGEVFILRDLEHYRQVIGVTGFRCPACGEISLKDPYECSAWDGKKKCGWKSYGFLGTLGKGLRVVLRDVFLTDPVVYEIFMPVALEPLFENGKLIPGAKFPD